MVRMVVLFWLDRNRVDLFVQLRSYRRKIWDNKTWFSSLPGRSRLNVSSTILISSKFMDILMICCIYTSLWSVLLIRGCLIFSSSIPLEKTKLPLFSINFAQLSHSCILNLWFIVILSLKTLCFMKESSKFVILDGLSIEVVSLELPFAVLLCTWVLKFW